jgi:exodeoxyribonuclease VII large subunit
MIAVLSVSEFISSINEIIAGECVVEGEVTHYSISQNKWVFFDLKDEGAVLHCFSTIFMLPQPLEEGMKVRVLGYPKIHDKSGKFSFTVQKVELVGEGSFKRAYVALKKKLIEEGLFDPARKRALPIIPECIGVIASRDSAAWGDFKRIVSNRWGGLEILLRHTTVQGEDAVRDITEAFKAFNQEAVACDVIVLIRGGGSLEDLAAFNSEEVVRAIYGSRTPVVVGVGHERDETLADFAADVRASTPTDAAEIVVPDRVDFIAQCMSDVEYVGQTLEHQIFRMKEVVDRAVVTMVNTFGTRAQDLRNLFEMFKHSGSFLSKKLIQYQEFIKSTEVLFKNVDPQQILHRGFSITRDEKGRIIRSQNQVDKGEKIMVELAKGIIRGEVI